MKGLSSKMANQKLIRFDPDIMEVLKKVERGERTKFVNECVRAHAVEIDEDFQKKAQKDKSSESSDNSNKKNASSLNSQKPSDEAEATTHENSKHSAHEAQSTTALTKFLRRSEEKP